ncbi:bifunctional nicotinamide-nucleotide adenylyltransferase/Nudix hydroxylase [Ramlibacter albus]|uniref:Bifunctional nicotinamide-nucleotide adenylyltransferase/Nudix hydroxylase n=1 Tax=Ramlibacter albus TaxID=2079448 RepID=A0A923MDV1_9BURK|nr:bifunctional nicotinamide-nucleotide adenylyltransferase/Nudix hydroxylase [Ramlibacter albus]
MTRHDVAVCIGRFQPFHNAQLHLLERALTIAPKVVVVIGSAWQARTPRNPFTWEERAQMIRLALPEAERERIHFVPMRDYYDARRWVGEVQAAVAHMAGNPAARIALVGHRKDATSDYLQDFPGWALVDVGYLGPVHGKALRDAYFTASTVDAALAAMSSQLPPSTVDVLRAWAALPFHARIREEWLELAKEHAQWANTPYPPVFVTVDAVIRVSGHVLLIRRGHAPGKGLLALPGGFIEQRETVYQSAVRELAEETGFELLHSDMQHALKDVRVFDHPDRSQRGRVITHVHYFDLGERRLPEVHAGDDAREAKWVAIDQLAALEDEFHDDHFHILDSFFDLTST